MLGKLIPYGQIPFFWTRNYNKSLQYIGRGDGYKEIHITGDLKGTKFVAYYIDGDDNVIACSGMNKGPDILTLLEAMQQNMMPKASLIKSGDETP